MYYETMLIPFDMVLDIDFSIIRTIQLMYQHNILSEDEKKMYSPSLMSLVNINDGIYIEEILVNRLFENPLSAIMKQEFLPTHAESILDNLKIENYNELVKTARKTAIYEMVRHGYNMKDSGFAPTILCETEIEKNTIVSHFNKDGISYPCILLKDLDSLDPYGSIFCKSESILQKITNMGFVAEFKIEGKNIMVSNHRYNYASNDARNKGVINPEIFKKYELLQNKLFTLNIYNLDNKIVG